MNKLSQVTEHEGGRTVQSSYSQSLLSSLYLPVAKKQLIDVHKIFLLYAQGQQLSFVRVWCQIRLENAAYQIPFLEIPNTSFKGFEKSCLYLKRKKFLTSPKGRSYPSN